MIIFFRLIVLFSLVGASTFSQASLNVFKKKDRSYLKIAIYETTALEQKFIIIGKVTLQGLHQNQLVKKFKKSAKKNGGDAVLKYHTVSCEKLPQFSTALIGNFKLPCAEGVIIKFDDENGINEITATTPIPVLQ